MMPGAAFVTEAPVNRFLSEKTFYIIIAIQRCSAKLTTHVTLTLLSNRIITSDYTWATIHENFKLVKMPSGDIPKQRDRWRQDVRSVSR